MSDQAKQNVELAFLSYEEGEKITKIRTVRKMSDGTTAEATLKAFSGTWAKIKSDIDSAISSGAVEAWTIENKGTDRPDWFLLWKVAQRSSGGGARGGGAAKSDPAKNETIAKANQNNNSTIQAGNTLNNAANVVRMAVDLVGKGGSVDQVQVIANDLADLTLQIQAKFIGGQS